MADWYCNSNGRQTGPMETAAVRQLIASGRLRPADLVWRDGMAEWAAVSTVAELRPVTAGGAPSGMAPGSPSTPPSVPTPILSYVAPVPYSSDYSIWREGKLIVALSGTPMPQRCVKCNEPANPNRRWIKKLYYAHPALYLLILVNLLIMAIVIIAVRKKVDVNVGLCDAHLRARRSNILIAWGITLGGFGLIALSIYFFNDNNFKQGIMGPVVLIGGVCTILSALVWAIVKTPVLTVRRYKNGYGWFSGGGPAFLATLPDVYVPPAG